MKIITIGHFLLSLGLGGMENGVVRLINHSSVMFRHVIICLEDDLSLKDRIVNPNVKIIVLGRFSIITNALKLLRSIQDEKIDILHARGWPTMMEGALVRCLRPSFKNVFSFHGRSYLELQKVSKRRRILQIILARLYKKITTLNEFMRQEIAREYKVNAREIGVLPNGVEESVVEDEEELRGIREQLGIDSNDFVFGYVGRLDPVKDVETLIDAFHLFYLKIPDSKLIIVGEGEQRNFLQQKLRFLSCRENVTFVDFTDRISRYYHLFDVYIQASLYEGLSNTILEALAHGLPVICTHVGGNSDVVVHGENGYLVPVGDPHSFCCYMKELAQDEILRYSMKTRNIDKIRYEYSLRKMAQSYEKVYYELLP